MNGYARFAGAAPEPLAVAVVGGAGFVGTVTAVGLAHLGHWVTVVDVNRERLAALSAGQGPFLEPGLPELLRSTLASGRLTFTPAIDEAASRCSVIFIAVNTLRGSNGEADLSQVIRVASDLARCLSRHTTIVVKSTVPVGSHQTIRHALEEAGRREEIDYNVVANPEFLREGHAVYDFFYPDRIVLGGRSRGAVDLVRKLFKPLGALIIETSIENAQMIKYAANAFLATRVSFINEIANICEHVGADIEEVVEGLGYDKRIGHAYLRPGLGFSGPCLPKDLEGLIRMSEEVGYAPLFLRAVLEKNEHQVQQILQKVYQLVGQSLGGRRIAILGLTFKPGTNDIRNSTALRIAGDLIQRGAEVVCFDPLLSAFGPKDIPGGVAGDAYQAATGADLLLLLTAWKEFRHLNYGRIYRLMRSANIVDGVNVLDPEPICALGFSYLSVGRTINHDGRASPQSEESAVSAEPEQRGYGLIQPVRQEAANHVIPAGVRIVLYSHDTMGLGHVRRNLLIAGTLASSGLGADILIIAGVSHAGSFEMPPGVDCLTLPALHKDLDGTYTSRQFDLSLSELVALRSRIIRSAIDEFVPDVLIVDNVPRGAVGELDDVLNALRRRGAHCVVGLRDVLDDPSVVREEWRRQRYTETVERYYDAVWVYGDPVVYDPVQEYRFPSDIGAKVHYTGYLDQVSRLQSAAVVDEPLMPPDLPKRFVLCLVGGGQDGERLADAFVRATFPRGAEGVILTGPFMPQHVYQKLRHSVAGRPVRVIDFVREPALLVSRAERVIGMGGYNTVCEVLSFERPALIVPRVRPRREQLIRAERLSLLGLFDMLHPDDVTSDVLSRWLGRDVMDPPRARERIDMNGLARLPVLLAEILRTSPVQGVGDLLERAGQPALHRS